MKIPTVVHDKDIGGDLDASSSYSQLPTHDYPTHQYFQGDYKFSLTQCPSNDRWSHLCRIDRYRRPFQPDADTEEDSDRQELLP